VAGKIDQCNHKRVLNQEASNGSFRSRGLKIGVLTRVMGLKLYY